MNVIIYGGIGTVALVLSFQLLWALLCFLMLQLYIRVFGYKSLFMATYHHLGRCVKMGVCPAEDSEFHVWRERHYYNLVQKYRGKGLILSLWLEAQLVPLDYLLKKITSRQVLR
jgi:hypothetical protein